jgi:acyl dehydratase
VSLQAGQQLPAQRFRVTRADLVRYAGASGDFNPIHWSERFATGVGLPGVIAHGMFTMALAGRAVTAWAGAPDAVLDFTVRFSRPVPVPDDDTGTELEVSGQVRSIEDGRAELHLVATCAGARVLSQARATIKVA